MPMYVYECKKCDSKIEEYRSIKLGPELNKKCKCGNKLSIVYFNVSIIDFTPKTVGCVADRNSAKYSSDYKHHLNKEHTKYRGDDDEE